MGFNHMKYMIKVIMLLSVQSMDSSGELLQGLCQWKTDNGLMSIDERALQISRIYKEDVEMFMDVVVQVPLEDSDEMLEVKVDHSNLTFSLMDYKVTTKPGSFEISFEVELSGMKLHFDKLDLVKTLRPGRLTLQETYNVVQPAGNPRGASSEESEYQDASAYVPSCSLEWEDLEDQWHYRRRWALTSVIEYVLGEETFLCTGPKFKELIRNYEIALSEYMEFPFFNPAFCK